MSTVNVTVWTPDITVEVWNNLISIITNTQGPAWSMGIIWQGAYNGATAYVVDDAVSYNGSSYICILNSTGNLPTNGTYWEIIASKGDTGATWATWATWSQGIQWETWATGAAGPNTVTTSTTTNITGLFKGNWSTVSAAAAGTDYAAPLWSDDNYVTDAEKVVIGNTSGTNSGNETATSIGALIWWAGDATPNDTDYVATSLTAGGILKRITWTNVKAFLKTYFDTLYLTVGSTITLSENTSLALDPAWSADGKYTGITVTGTAWATLAFWDVIVLDVTASKWLLADANSAAAADGDARGLIGMCVLAASDTQPTTILLQGIIRADANFPALTITAPVYLSETAWDIVVAQPVTTDAVIRVLWFALTADEIYFNPSSDYITHI